jgi:hypothetical protein
MDNSVALVQAYLRVNGYFTVTEYPVIASRGGHPRQLVISPGHIARFLRTYIDADWEVLRHSDTKDPAFGFLMTLAKAERGMAQ